MKNVKFTADVEGAKKKNKVIKGTGRAARYQLTSWGSKAEQVIKRNVTGGIVGKYKGGVRTGDLMRSIKFKIRGTKDNPTIEIGSWGVKYAGVLERGRTIRPKRKQYLTIPFPGVKGRAKNFSNTFFHESKRGNLVLMQNVGTGIKPLFLLKKSVRIPAFKWLEKSVKSQRALLNRMLSKKELLRIAERLK